MYDYATEKADFWQMEPKTMIFYALGGDDIMYGSSENDTIDGGKNNDYLVGIDGDDILIGGKGKDVLVGGRGDDRLVGNGGKDTLISGEGNDLLWGGAGCNILSGGAGSDKFVLGQGIQRIRDLTWNYSDPAQNDYLAIDTNALKDAETWFGDGEFDADRLVYGAFTDTFQRLSVQGDRLVVDDDGIGESYRAFTIALSPNMSSVNVHQFLLL